MKKLAIVCDAAASPIMQKAVGVLSEILLDYTYEYPICVKSAEKVDKENFRLIFIGTKENNPYIAQSDIEIPKKPEGYALRVKDETVIIAGFDDAGVLYGCMDFYNKYIVGLEFPDDDRYRINAFEQRLTDFEYRSAPAVKNRGIWTWGHVIYDYRKYIDNMVKLKLNTLIMWNDFVPVNARDMVEYAHSCGVKIIWGYAWGWDTNCEQFLDGKVGVSSQAIFEKYEREYASLGGDGIYFQSFTELNSQEIGGKLIAQAVTEFVNQTAALFCEMLWDCTTELDELMSSVALRDYVDFA